MSLISTIGRPLVKRLVAPGALMAAAAMALALGAPALGSGTGAGRTFAGKGPNGLVVSLSRPYSRTRGRARPVAIRHFRYQVTLRCADGTTFADKRFADDVKVKHGGHFHSRFRSDGGATVTRVTGRIVRRRAQGTLSISERYSTTPNAQGNYPLDPHGTVSCSSGTVHWKARAH